MNNNEFSLYEAARLNMMLLSTVHPENTSKHTGLIWKWELAAKWKPATQSSQTTPGYLYLPLIRDL